MSKIKYEKEFKLRAVNFIVDQDLSINKVKQDLGIALSILTTLGM